MAKEPVFAFFGSSVDSQFALAQLERRGLVPAVVIDGKEIPEELYNTEWDFFLVASYGRILKKDILDLPRRGCINIHPSLLPRFRGPSPYVSAILADERATGVTVMLMEEKMDTGPILAQARIEIAEEEWPPKGLMLSEMLFTEGANLVADILPEWLDGSLVPEMQDDSLATYTKKFNDEDALIDLSKPREAFLKIQAFDKSPRAHFFKGPSTGSGQVKRVVVTEAVWKGGELEILKVLPESKKEMPYEEYLRGQR